MAGGGSGSQAFPQKSAGSGSQPDHISRMKTKMDYIVVNQVTLAEQNRTNIQLAALQQVVTIDKSSQESKDVRLDRMYDQQIKFQKYLYSHMEVQQKHFDEIFDRIHEQLKAVLNKLEGILANSTGAKASAVESIPIPPKFELIGSRYFYIEDKVQQDFETAASTCIQMGGYLASIKDEEELNLIRMKLRKKEGYWLGTNDHKEKGSFVSLASRKPAFVKWARGEPLDFFPTNCIELFYSRDVENMMLMDCDSERYFICQADKEI
ncbi:accessory gland protein Acp29AB-like [Drosophila rhopaloa]|uniref:Accessory gland protein Acp29AB-like n=1 Tax=Drosophila rhopaloa TaxID=1041015 RepID=A0A6P4F175_DRORH|nr:accessory gland protein Acp29AB-like [Drosophila rhopaloa]